MDLGKLTDQAKNLVEQHGDKIEDGLDKAADFAKSKTDHDDKIDMVVDKAKDFLDKQGPDRSQG